MKLTLAVLLLALAAPAADDHQKAFPFCAQTKKEAARWQEQARQRLFTLMMGGQKPGSVPLAPTMLRTERNPSTGATLEEVSFQSLPDRRVHAWIGFPQGAARKAPAVLALHGHGGSGEQVLKGTGLYWYGMEFLRRGYVVISPDIGSHELQHTNWSLMGERVWDAIRTLDYLCTRPEIDKRRIAVAGLSLGGETTMYVAAMDLRIKAACSSGWLTTVENMKNGHCPCWNFPGLEQTFDFSDIFVCVAPRPLVLEIGRKERAPGGFPVEIAEHAFARIAPAYQLLKAEDKLILDLHSEGHVFHGREFWSPLRNAIGP